MVAENIAKYYRSSELPGTNSVNLVDVTRKVAQVYVSHTIYIPRISVAPIGEVHVGYHPFQLDLTQVRFQPVAENLIQHALRTGERRILTIQAKQGDENRLEDYLVAELVTYDDISYDHHADFLYELATQVVDHLRSYLKDEVAVDNVLRYYQHDLGRLIHSQLVLHQYEDATKYITHYGQGFTRFKDSPYSLASTEHARDFRLVPNNLLDIKKYIFGGFERCLYPLLKFDSDTERRLAIILDRESIKWFRPVNNQFEIEYRHEGSIKKYQPDFVAETETSIYMLEPKSSTELANSIVLLKKEAAEKWCEAATTYSNMVGGKPWKYALIAHDRVQENMTLLGLVS
jgi:type III restriction enzyme